MVSVSTNLFGPYGPPQCALRLGGHNDNFNDYNGDIQATIWSARRNHHAHSPKVSILPLRIGNAGPAATRADPSGGRQSITRAMIIDPAMTA
jgi:hypothetical protein